MAKKQKKKRAATRYKPVNQAGFRSIFVLRRVRENTAKRREVLMTDIIERLRNLHDHYPTSGQLGAENIKIFQEAADEIEVLRIGIDQIKYFVGTFPREPASAYLPKRDQSIKLVK